MIYKIKSRSGVVIHVELEYGVVTMAPTELEWLKGMTTNQMVNVCKERQWEYAWQPSYTKELEEVAPKIAPAETVVHPVHYNLHPSGVECITIVQHMNFNVGNAMKYLWRCGLKDNTTDVEDLKKARQYIDYEISRLASGPVE